MIIKPIFAFVRIYNGHNSWCKYNFIYKGFRNKRKENFDDIIFYLKIFYLILASPFVTYTFEIYIYIIDFKGKTTKRYFHGLIIMKKIIRR